MTPPRLIKHISGGVEGAIALVEHHIKGVVILKTRIASSNGPQISNEANLALTLLNEGRTPRTTICQVLSSNGPNMSDLIIEWCDGGDLRHVINQLHSQGYCLSMSFLRHAQLHLGSALVYLHTGIFFYVNTGICKHPSPSSGPWNQITHRDLKSDNVFLRWTNKVDHFCFPDLVIGDLGSAVTARPFVSVFQGMGLIE